MYIMDRLLTVYAEIEAQENGATGSCLQLLYYTRHSAPQKSQDVRLKVSLTDIYIYI